MPLDETLVKESNRVGCQTEGPMGVLSTLAKENVMASIDFSPFFCLLLHPRTSGISADLDGTHRPLSHFWGPLFCRFRNLSFLVSESVAV